MESSRNPALTRLPVAPLADRTSETTGCSMPSRRSVLALMASLLGLSLAGPAAAFVAPGAGMDSEVHASAAITSSTAGC